MTNKDYKALRHDSGAGYGTCKECHRSCTVTLCSYRCDDWLLCCECLPPHYTMHKLAGEQGVQWVKADMLWAEAARQRREITLKKRRLVLHLTTATSRLTVKTVGTAARHGACRGSDGARTKQ